MDFTFQREGVTYFGGTSFPHRNLKLDFTLHVSSFGKIEDVHLPAVKDCFDHFVEKEVDEPITLVLSREDDVTNIMKLSDKWRSLLCSQKEHDELLTKCTYHLFFCEAKSLKKLAKILKVFQNKHQHNFCVYLV